MTNVSNVRQPPVICSSIHVKTCSFFRTSWQVTCPGSMGTTRRQNSNRHSGRVPRLRDQRGVIRSEAKIKVMLLASFDSEGIVHHEYAPDERTINKEFHPEFLRHLRKSVPWKRPQSSNQWTLESHTYEVWSIKDRTEGAAPKSVNRTHCG